MCNNCEAMVKEITAKGELTQKEVTEYMKKIVDYIRVSGESIEHFADVIDALLQTKMPERDADVEVAYQNKIDGG